MVPNHHYSKFDLVKCLLTFRKHVVALKCLLSPFCIILERIVWACALIMYMQKIMCMASYAKELQPCVGGSWQQRFDGAIQNFVLPVDVNYGGPVEIYVRAYQINYKEGSMFWIGFSEGPATPPELKFSVGGLLEIQERITPSGIPQLLNTQFSCNSECILDYKICVGKPGESFQGLHGQGFDVQYAMASGAPRTSNIVESPDEVHILDQLVWASDRLVLTPDGVGVPERVPHIIRTSAGTLDNLETSSEVRSLQDGGELPAPPLVWDQPFLFERTVEPDYTSENLGQLWKVPININNHGSSNDDGLEDQRSGISLVLLILSVVGVSLLGLFLSICASRVIRKSSDQNKSARSSVQYQRRTLDVQSNPTVAQAEPGRSTMNSPLSTSSTAVTTHDDFRCCSESSAVGTRRGNQPFGLLAIF